MNDEPKEAKGSHHRSRTEGITTCFLSMTSIPTAVRYTHDLNAMTRQGSYKSITEEAGTQEVECE